MVTLGLRVFYDLGLSGFLFAPLRRGHYISYLAGLLWGSDVLSGQETFATFDCCVFRDHPRAW